MTNYHVLFGTESGNAEVVADDIVDALVGKGLSAEPFSMDSYDVAKLSKDNRYVFVTSTYGEGEMPESTLPFFNALISEAPELQGVEFFAFGLGDSTYQTYNNAIDLLSAKLRELGAIQIGDIGKHDANSGAALTAVAAAWVTQTF